MTNSCSFRIVLSALALLVTVAWGSMKAYSRSSYADPTEYCQAVRTVDFPENDKRYKGPKVPAWMYRAMHRTEGEPGYLAWRCEDRHVLACWNGGITGPCDKKDTSQHPTKDMVEFCNQQPGASDIPAAVTGHQTIYAWYCSGNIPQRGRQFMFPDRRGWQPDEWVRVER